MRRPEIFISAATTDLKSTREAVKQAVDTIGCHGFSQETFAPDYHTVTAMLRNHIAACDAVIHIVGICYGSEPKDVPADHIRRSFTQMEFDLAVELNRPLYVFVCTEDYPYDPHDNEPFAQARLQQKHREDCLNREEIWEKVATPQELVLRVSQLQAKLKRLERHIVDTGEFIRELVTVVEDTHRIVASGPKLKPLSIPVTGEPGLLHSDRRVRFVCREDEIGELEAFIDGPQQVAWQLWLGAAGMGKTRLAFEFCRQIDQSWQERPGDWHAGFLDFKRSQAGEWSSWRPSKPTFIVIDYVEEHADEVSTLIEQVAQSAQHASFPKVRFLLLNRDKEVKWFDRFYGHDDHTSWIASTAFVTMEGQNRSEHKLKPFAQTDLHTVVAAIIEARNAIPPQTADRLAQWGEQSNHTSHPSMIDQIVSKFSGAMFELRPLFVALATEAVLDGRELSTMNHESLAREAIQHEVAMWRKYFSGENADDDLRQHQTLVALATSAEGFDLPVGYRSLYEQLAAHGLEDSIPPPRTFAHDYDSLEKFYSLGRDDDGERIPALRPDYIGELFVLDHLQSSLKTPSIQRAFAASTLALHPEGVL
ncbi:MAG: DUF4062 domain-containing protein, partial [Caldilineaceae bacterium]|nr:DUF4062 domain-containing protein [Caldilineaceae bacterium]